MTIAQRAVDNSHECVERHIQECVAHHIIGHLQLETRAVGMMGERGERLIFALHAHAAPELLIGVFGTEHVYESGHKAQLLVEQVAELSAESLHPLTTHGGGTCQLCHSPPQHIHIGLLMSVIVVVGLGTVATKQAKCHRRHASLR